MKKISAILSFLLLMIILGSFPSTIVAFDRNVFVQGTRVVSISNFTYNINSVNISLNSGPVSVGSNDHSLPAYQTVAQITAQIQALKEKLKNFPVK